MCTADIPVKHMRSIDTVQRIRVLGDTRTEDINNVCIIYTLLTLIIRHKTCFIYAKIFDYYT